MPSQYSAENVSVSGGGRAALTRAAASLGHVNLGHFLPDYTAYEELLDIFKAFTRDPDPARGRARLRVLRRRSAPRDPRARPVGAAAVEPVQPDRQARSAATSSRAGSRWRASSTARCSSTSSTRTTSGRGAGRAQLPVESAARYVEDVDRDPVVIFDGLTKNWRYPGWRVTWTVGPKQRHRGGRQRRLVPRRRRLEAAAARGDPAARRRARRRRDQRDPDGVPRASATACSPASRASASRIDRAARRHVLRLGQGRRACRRRSTTAWASSAPRSSKQVIAVPGEFFDVNPGKRRSQRASRFRRHVRFSFGPAMDNLEIALGRSRNADPNPLTAAPTSTPRCSAAASSPCRSGRDRRSRRSW